jgi:hypothetical protein
MLRWADPVPDRTPYNLYVSIDGRWEFVAEVRARSHSEAFRAAMLALRPEHYDKPVKLEQPAIAPPIPPPPHTGAAVRKTRKGRAPRPR